MNKVLQIDPRDNVLIALTDLKRGDSVTLHSHSYVLESDVAAKHKFAREELAAGADVIMYGVIVGKPRAQIRRGEAVTTRNIRHDAAAFREKSREYAWNPPDVKRWRERTFTGFRRADGQVGTRNYWLVIPLVFCENRNILNLKQAFEEELGFARPQVYRRQVAELARAYREGRALTASAANPREQQTAPSERIFPNVDGIKFLLHEGGCGGT